MYFYFMEPEIILKLEELRKKAKEDNWNPPRRKHRKTVLDRLIKTKEQAEIFMWFLNRAGSTEVSIPATPSTPNEFALRWPPELQLKLEELRKKAKEDNWNPPRLNVKRSSLHAIIKTKEQVDFLMWQLNKK